MRSADNGWVNQVIIVITGTPGTGKTSVARKLAAAINGIHIDVSRFVIDNKLYVDYDDRRKSYIIDEKRVVDRLTKNTSSYTKPVIIDIHYPEILPSEIVDYVIVLRTHPEELYRRLKTRNWPLHKVKENVMAEILGVVVQNIIEHFDRKKIYEIDTTNKTIDEVVEEIIDIIKGSKSIGQREHIDWLEKIPIEVIKKYEDY